jgi:hypothetical protein
MRLIDTTCTYEGSDGEKTSHLKRSQTPTRSKVIESVAITAAIIVRQVYE